MRGGPGHQIHSACGSSHFDMGVCFSAWLCSYYGGCVHIMLAVIG